MNGISWLLYLADVGVRVANTFSFVAFFAAIGILAVCIFSQLYESRPNTLYFKRGEKDWILLNKKDWNDLYYSNYPRADLMSEERRTKEYLIPGIIRYNYLLIPIFFVSIFFSTCIPSRDTVLLIATSEFAEDFSQSEAGNEIGGLAMDTLKYLRGEMAKLNASSESK